MTICAAYSTGPVAAEYRAAVAEKMGIVILATTYLGTRQVNLRTARTVDQARGFGRREDAHAVRAGVAAAGAHARVSALCRWGCRRCIWR